MCTLCDELLTDHDYFTLHSFPRLEVMVENLFALCHRLEVLNIDCVIGINTFLDYAISSQASLPWPCLKRLEITGYEFKTQSHMFRCLDKMRELMACMSTLEVLEIKTLVIDWDAASFLRKPRFVSFKAKAEYVKTTDRDDHVMLAVRPSRFLKAPSVHAWDRAVQKGRGVPLRVSTLDDEDEEWEENWEATEEEEDGEEDDQQDDVD